jgi:hypothetical protein
MLYQKKSLMLLLLGCGILFCACAITVKAQFVRPPIGTISTPKTSRGNSAPRVTRLPPVVKVIREVTVKSVVTRTSNLSVSTEPGATVLLEPLDPRQKKLAKKLTVGKEGSVVFENLQAIKHKIRVEKIGFETQEQEPINILPQKTQAINMDLKAITLNLSIKTNISKGEVRYAPADLKEKRPDGSLSTIENGAYCIEPIKNNQAIIKGLKNGYYNIDIRPTSDDIQYNPVLTAVEISTETANDDDDGEDGSLSFEIPLLKKISEGRFATTWTTDEWEKPAGWKLGKTMKTDGSIGVALPRNEQYRYYTDFEMTSDVRLTNADTVGFVIRAEDDKNYYLFQISGAKAETPHVIKGYIVKNGKEEPPFFTQPIAPFAKTIAEGNFRVLIKGSNNIFSVFIEDIANGGEPRPVGIFTDPSSKFRKGAVGIAGRKNWNFEIGYFTVCARQCN